MNSGHTSDAIKVERLRFNDTKEGIVYIVNFHLRILSLLTHPLDTSPLTPPRGWCLDAVPIGPIKWRHWDESGMNLIT